MAKGVDVCIFMMIHIITWIQDFLKILIIAFLSFSGHIGIGEPLSVHLLF